MTEVTCGVTRVVYLATNRSDVYVVRWSRRTLRCVIDWFDATVTSRSVGAWTTERESEGPACD